MPYIISPENVTKPLRDVTFRRNYRYTYPDGLRLKPGTELHDKIVAQVLTRASLAKDAISTRYDSWNEVDRVLTTYMVVDDDEQDIQSKDSRKPVSIVFPYSYAMMESILTYLTLAFWQDPLFRYEGAGGEDTVGAMLLEFVINLHCQRSKVPLALHTLFRDSLAYGFGMGSPAWEMRQGYKVQASQGMSVSPMGELYSIGQQKSVDTDVVFEGNALFNIDPYTALPDPNVSITDIQKGEFIGWVASTNYYQLLRQEANGQLFNVRYLEELQTAHSVYATAESARGDKTGEIKPTDHTDTNRVDVIYMYMDLIPKEWKLGPSDQPERWMFAVAGDAVLIDAGNMGLVHGQYPVVTCAPEHDGYSALPMGRLEVLYGLQHVMDFLFNSHIANVRKSLNDMFIVDPSMVNILDLKNPKPGKLIRLRKPAWGTARIDSYIKQFQVSDITRQNIGDSQYIAQWMEKIAGVDGSMMGATRQGGPERLTSAEFRGTRSSAISRLERLARLISSQAMYDIARFFAIHTQQFMSQELYARTVGDHGERLSRDFGIQQGSAVRVTPFDVLVDFDVLIRDGSVPGGNFNEAWLQLWEGIAQSPELQQEFDTVRIFSYIARNLGAKNVDEFRRQKPTVQPIVAPDDQVLRQAERGNVIPMRGAM